MATKKSNPFAAFEKSSADKKSKGVKEDSRKDKASDRKQMPKTAAKKKKC